MSDTKAAYTPRTFNELIGVKVIFSPHVLDNQIVLRAPRSTKNRPSLNPQVFASFKVSIWNLDTGVIGGDCKLGEATELHMSRARYADLDRMIVDWNGLVGFQEAGEAAEGKAA